MGPARPDRDARAARRAAAATAAGPAFSLFLLILLRVCREHHQAARALLPHLIRPVLAQLHDERLVSRLPPVSFYRYTIKDKVQGPFSPVAPSG